MGLLDRVASRTAYKAGGRIADKVSDSIVDKIFGKEEERAPIYSPEPMYSNPQSANINISGSIPDMSGQMSGMMGMAYNTKKCPKCQSVCFNSPVECPYCKEDIRNVAPLKPEELEKL